MTLRARLAVLTSVAVALAVLAASVAAWLLIRQTLMDEVDRELLSRASETDRIAQAASEAAAEEGMRFHVLVQGQPIGVQEIAPDGEVLSMFPPGNVAFEIDADEQRLLDGATEEPQLRTETIDGVPLRIMTAALSNGGVIRLIQRLDHVERTMTRMAWLLLGVAGAGVAGAGVLGWLIARAGLRPVNRLADAAEQVAATKDLAHRVEMNGNRRDEVGRLAGAVNSMLAALDSARTQQRQLVENAGHELRTPLATLRNDIGVLRRAEQHPERAFAPGDRAQLLQDLESEAAALSDLVAELVDLARGGVEPEPPLETDLRALIDRAVARTRRINPQVTVAVQGCSFEATARPVALERAIVNLVRNAVQVSQDGGRVEVELVEENGRAVVQVRDRGPGIADHDLPRLFDRFYRGDGARERHGSGLGLAIVAQAAEQHAGSVEASNRDGGGAVFTLRIPV